MAHRNSFPITALILEDVRKGVFGIRKITSRLAVDISRYNARCHSSFPEVTNG